MKWVVYLEMVLNDEIGIFDDSVMFSSMLETFATVYIGNFMLGNHWDGGHFNWWILEFEYATNGENEKFLVGLFSRQRIVKLIANIMSMYQIDTLRKTSIVWELIRLAYRSQGDGFEYREQWAGGQYGEWETEKEDAEEEGEDEEDGEGWEEGEEEEKDEEEEEEEE